VLFGGYFGDSIVVSEAHDVIGELGKEFHGAAAMMLHAFGQLPFWLLAAGIATAAFLYLKRTDLPEKLRAAFGPITALLDNKYYLDRFNDWFFAGGARLLGRGFWKVGDVAVIDGFFVNGSARVVSWAAQVARRMQSGLIYHYAFTMIIGVFVLLTLWFARS
jgi:NADH-quinone oxidoreductase subunit L